MLAADVSPWLRPEAATSPDRLFCHVHGRGKAPVVVFMAARMYSCQDPESDLLGGASGADLRPSVDVVQIGLDHLGEHVLGGFVRFDVSAAVVRACPVGKLFQVERTQFVAEVFGHRF